MPERSTRGEAQERAQHEQRLTAAGNLRGIAYVIAAMAFFSCGDTLMKLAAGKIPTSELLFIRGAIVTSAAVAVCISVGAFINFRHALSWPMALRAGGDIGGGWFFQSALARMQLPDLSAIGQLGPLMMTAASALFLGEKVGWRRWTAAFVGLVGVLLIIRPGTSAFTWWSVVGILSVVSGTVRDLATRRVDRRVHGALIMAISAFAVTMASLAVAPFAGWQMPAGLTVLEAAGAAGFSLSGQLCLIKAMRSGEVSAVAPFRYSIIPFVILSGIVVFGYLPDMTTLLGIAIVVAAGLYTFFREQKLRRLALAAAAEPRAER